MVPIFHVNPTAYFTSYIQLCKHVKKVKKINPINADSFCVFSRACWYLNISTSLRKFTSKTEHYLNLRLCNEIGISKYKKGAYSRSKKILFLDRLLG